MKSWEVLKTTILRHNREFFSKIKKVVTSTWKSNFWPDDKSSHAPTCRIFFWSESNHFLSEWSSPLGLPNIYMSELDETLPEISIFPLFPWITHLLLGCFTKLFLLFGYSSLCIPCPDQYKPFSCVKENFCTFIIGKSWIFLAKILDVGKFDSFTDFQS